MQKTQLLMFLKIEFSKSCSYKFYLDIKTSTVLLDRIAPLDFRGSQAAPGKEPVRPLKALKPAYLERMAILREAFLVNLVHAQ